MHRRVLAAEQASTLATRLREEGVLHGDTVLLELTGVGTKPGLASGTDVLCFCPTAVRVLKVVSEGTAEERRQPIPDLVSYHSVAAKTILRHVRGRGFVTTMKATVHTNGSISFVEAHDLSFRPVPADVVVSKPDSYQMYLKTVK